MIDPAWVVGGQFILGVIGVLVLIPLRRIEDRLGRVERGLADVRGYLRGRAQPLRDLDQGALAED